MRPLLTYNNVLMVIAIAYCSALNITDRVKGSSNVGIEGGWTIDIESVPYQVSVRFYGEHQCGGVAIRDKYIITGALCIPINESTYAHMTVLAGTADLKSGGREYNVSKGMKHERFDVEGLDHDIGLIKITETLDFSSKVKLARLAQAGPIFGEGMTFNVTGWGWQSINIPTISHLLKQATVTWMKQASCQRYYEGGTRMNYRMFCSKKNRGPCPFDYGGPVTVNGIVIGIISGAARYCDLYPPVYTKISAYRSWIQDTIDMLD